MIAERINARSLFAASLTDGTRDSQFFLARRFLCKFDGDVPEVPPPRGSVLLTQLIDCNLFNRAFAAAGVVSHDHCQRMAIAANARKWGDCDVSP